MKYFLKSIWPVHLPGIWNCRLSDCANWVWKEYSKLLPPPFCPNRQYKVFARFLSICIIIYLIQSSQSTIQICSKFWTGTKRQPMPASLLKSVTLCIVLTRSKEIGKVLLVDKKHKKWMSYSNFDGIPIMNGSFSICYHEKDGRCSIRSRIAEER